MRIYVSQEELNKKQNKPTLFFHIENPLNLQNNSEYILSNVSDLSIIFPTEEFHEVWLKISTDTNVENINITFPLDAKWISSIPTFLPNQTWELSIKNKVIIAWRVE